MKSPTNFNDTPMVSLGDLLQLLAIYRPTSLLVIKEIAEGLAEPVLADLGREDFGQTAG